MSNLRYENIQPLIAAAEQQGASMRVTFRCPVSGFEVQASAGLRADDSISGRAAQRAKRSLMWSVRSAISRAVRSALGHGVLGSAASSVASDVVQAGGEQVRYSDSDKEAAMVRAFESVQSQFAWDAEKGQFISAQAAGDMLPGFTRQLQIAPATSKYDRGVLARMLTEIAAADGELGDDERAFVSGFVTPDIGTVDSLMAAGRLSTAELSETTQGPVRETMLMLAWGVAFTDESLAPQEEVRLGEYAEGLGLAEARVAELKSDAQMYLLDQALHHAYAGGQKNAEAHAEAMRLAQRLGIDPTAAERADIRFRKRHGLV
ncbi:hypothetical protein [Haliangium sp.]|uniref:hypothetical protein n=1 Tax=Haliangium sp. TaxID=2663208 RepID=UPI003D13A1FD